MSDEPMIIPPVMTAPVKRTIMSRLTTWFATYQKNPQMEALVTVADAEMRCADGEMLLYLSLVGRKRFGGLAEHRFFMPVSTAVEVNAAIRNATGAFLQAVGAIQHGMAPSEELPPPSEKQDGYL